MNPSASTVFMTVITLAALGEIGAGLSLIDSPSDARLRALDTKRVADLRRLGTRIDSYYKSHNQLPERLDQLDVPERRTKDVVTGQPYDYKSKDSVSYELCGVFDLVASQEDEQNPFNEYGNCTATWWKHGQGRYCYSLTAKSCR